MFLCGNACELHGYFVLKDMGGGFRGAKRKSKGPRLPGTLLKEIGGISNTARRSFQKPSSRKRSRETGSQHSARPENGPARIEKRDGKVTKHRKLKVVESAGVPEEDPELVLQRQLAKKLGMKSTELKKNDDGLDDLLGELDDIMMGNDVESSSSDEDSENDEEKVFSLYSSGSQSSDEAMLDDSGSESDDAEENVPTQPLSKYIPPALRNKTKNAENDEQEAAVSRKVRGLVNRMTESNIEGIVTELCSMYKNEGRSYVSRSLSHELISASSEGPRASERFAVVAAACVASLGGLTESSEVVATFLSNLGRELEQALDEDDSLACTNLVRLLGCLYLAKAVKSDLMFDVLNSWGDAFSDKHVVSIAGLLTVAGLALRKSDPSLMKNFVIDIHDKASNHGDMTTRAKVMLDLVVDVKNNRMKSRQGALSISGNGSATLANALPPNVSNWFKTCNVEAIAVGGIPWSKVVCSNNKGFWWIPTLNDKIENKHDHQSYTLEPESVGNDIDSFSHAELLKLASKLKMSTDTRRSIFLATMGSEDAIDAAEKLLRLNLKGQQEREIVKVIIECSLHEKTWNIYYGLVLNRLCKLAKGHRVTLQYCLWDHMKDVDRMNARKLAIFSKLCSYTVVSKVLPLHTLIKIADFNTSDMGAKELLVWRSFFKSIFEDVISQDDFRALFIRISEQKELSTLKKQLKLFLKMDVGPWLASKSTNAGGDEEKKLLKMLSRCNAAEKMLTK